VICHDVIGPVLNKLTHYMEAEPSLRPRSSAENVRKPLSGQYFKRIEAVEFTIKQDDGALCRNLGKADLILLGVSRSSKTPLSMYLAQQYGYKVCATIQMTTCQTFHIGARLESMPALPGPASIRRINTPRCTSQKFPRTLSPGLGLGFRVACYA
jgi:hypothetical protein